MSMPGKNPLALLVDLGNTGFRWCWAARDALFEVVYLTHRSSDIYDVASRAWEGAPTPASTWISSVAGPEINTRLTEWLEQHWSLTGHFVTAERRAFGIVNGYREATQLGVDRWLALIGARQIRQGATCVVDAGTAMTLDVLRPDGRHLGGFILPGLGTMREALLSGTRIPRVENVECPVFFADDTACAVASGARLALKGVIERSVQALEADVDGEVGLILTGSEASVLSQDLTVPHEIHPDLVLSGLARYAFSAE
jgi:type III pantothenate kinase